MKSGDVGEPVVDFWRVQTSMTTNAISWLLSTLAVDNSAKRVGRIIHFYSDYYNNKNCEKHHPYVEKKSTRFFIRRRGLGYQRRAVEYTNTSERQEKAIGKTKVVMRVDEEGGWVLKAGGAFKNAR